MVYAAYIVGYHLFMVKLRSFNSLFLVFGRRLGLGYLNKVLIHTKQNTERTKEMHNGSTNGEHWLNVRIVFFYFATRIRSYLFTKYQTSGTSSLRELFIIK